MTIVIDIQYATGSKDVPDRRKISKWARLALNGVRDAAVLTIRIVDAKEAAVLNKTWRGINKATNVLSFPAGDNPLMPELMGDVVICAPVISREAAEQDKTAQAHWAHMIIHGILHLAGYDHTGKRDAKKMEALEIEKLESINFPNPYE
jgi:probable rRNA maturation factor